MTGSKDFGFRPKALAQSDRNLPIGLDCGNVLRNPTVGASSVLVGRPSDSLSDDASFDVAIGPAERASKLGIGSDVSV
jgi:hypothetical protein